MVRGGLAGSKVVNGYGGLDTPPMSDIEQVSKIETLFVKMSKNSLKVF